MVLDRRSSPRVQGDKTTCLNCGEPYDLGPRSSLCPSCKSDYDRQRHIRNTAHRLENKRAYQSAAMFSQYGITMDEYDMILVEQGGVCAICHEYRPRLDSKGEPARMPIDHDHETDTVRGILCHWCNSGVGLLGEDAERLLAASVYLSKGVQD